MSYADLRQLLFYCKFYIWTASSKFGTYRLCEQRKFRQACASTQSHQNLRCSLIQAVTQEEPSDRKPDPWPLWMAGHVSWNLSWRNARRHKFAWRGSYANMNIIENKCPATYNWAASSDFVSSSIPSWQILMRMPSHSEGPGIWLSVWRFLLTHCLYERAAEVLARLRGCAGSPEPSLLA